MRERGSTKSGTLLMCDATVSIAAMVGNRNWEAPVRRVRQRPTVHAVYIVLLPGREHFCRETSTTVNGEHFTAHRTLSPFH